MHFCQKVYGTVYKSVNRHNLIICLAYQNITYDIPKKTDSLN